LSKPSTSRRIVSRMGLGSRNPAIVGSAEEVAEDLVSWVDETDIDDFNLSRNRDPRGSRVMPFNVQLAPFGAIHSPGA
jgi:alkanesulfonate monooxygenase SsuD/methylene tetrahydromethanopterin reductase-like flavin-dependent oxidoreductase (luciferase family)